MTHISVTGRLRPAGQRAKMFRLLSRVWPVSTMIGESIRGPPSALLLKAASVQTDPRPIHYHNLSSSTEGLRSFAFMLVDRSGVLHDDSESLENRLERLLSSPPKGTRDTLIVDGIMPRLIRQCWKQARCALCCRISCECSRVTTLALTLVICRMSARKTRRSLPLRSQVPTKRRQHSRSWWSICGMTTF